MKGPKQILAEAISKALAEYFVVDPSHIETNLVKNAGLTLHDVQLKPQQQPLGNNKNDAIDNESFTAHVQGSVSKVAFHWKWGGSSKEHGGSSWVNSAELTIDGLKVTVALQQDENGTTATDPVASGGGGKTSSNTAAPNETTAHAGGFKGYVQEQVERIIDTLRLSITDFEVRLQLHPNPKNGQVRSLSFGGAGFQLDSLGRTSNMDPLKQELNIANIFSNLIINTGSSGTDETTVLPILKPISYKATCVRVVGKRFQGGIQRGLHVQGESVDDGLVVHTGQEQISFFNDLGGILLASSAQQENEQSSTTKQVPETSQEESSEQELEECDMHSSYFQLPLAALSLMFPNGTKISMADLQVCYQMDGNICTVQGQQGFLVNDFPLLALADNGGFWQADMVQSKFCVAAAKQSEDDSPIRSATTTVAKVHARHDEIEQVKNGVNDLLEIYQTMLADHSGAVASLATAATNDSLSVERQAAASKTEASSSSAWTFDIDGDLDFCLNGPEQETVVDCRLSKIHAAMGNKTLTIDSVQKLDIPGSICLTQPLENSRLQFDGNLFNIQLGDILAKLHPPPPSQKPTNKTEEPVLSPENSPATTVSTDSSAANEGSPAFVLPFGAKAHINSVKIYETDGVNIHTTLKTIQAAIGPDPPKIENGQPSHTGGIRALLMLEDVEHDMISLTDPKLSAVIYPHDTGLVREFDFGAKTIAVAAGYSVFDWKRLFETGDEKREKEKTTCGGKQKKKTDVFLPFAHVHPLKVKIAVKGEVVGTKGTTLNINEFVGKENTVLRDVIRFYTARTMTSMPGMFRDADVLGFNVTDTAASQVGTAAGAGMLGALGGAAAPVAGVLGIVGFDGVKNTIKAGKKSRGVEDDDKMQFGDFFRGIGQTTKDATTAGAARRGKTAQDKADAFDWALGATSEATKYTSENKSRLGGAGAGTVGFAYGMVLGGPVGAVAGALIASKATSHTIDTLDSKYSKDKNKTSKNQNKAVN